MEQPIWVIIAIVIAILVLTLALVIINMSKEQGISNLSKIFNLCEFLKTVLKIQC